MERYAGFEPRYICRSRLANDVIPAALVLYIDNTGELYSQKKGIYKNLLMKWAKGTYDHEKAKKGFKYIVEAGAKRYAREIEDVGWSVSARREAASEMARDFAQSALMGKDHDYLLSSSFKKMVEERREKEFGKGASMAAKQRYAGLTVGEILKAGISRLAMKKADLIKWFKANKAPMPKGTGKEGRVLVRDLEQGRKMFLSKGKKKEGKKKPAAFEEITKLHGSGDEKAVAETVKKLDPKKVQGFLSKVWDGISNAGKKAAKAVSDHFVSKGWSEEHVASAMLLTGASAAAAGVVVGGLAAAVGGATAGIVPALMAGMFMFMPPAFKQLSKDTKLMEEAWADRREAEEELRQTREKYLRRSHGNLRISNNQQSNSEIQGIKKAFALLKRVEDPKAFFKRVQALAVKAFAVGEDKDIFTLMKAAL